MRTANDVRSSLGALSLRKLVGPIAAGAADWTLLTAADRLNAASTRARARPVRAAAWRMWTVAGPDDWRWVGTLARAPSVQRAGIGGTSGREGWRRQMSWGARGAIAGIAACVRQLLGSVRGREVWEADTVKQIHLHFVRSVMRPNANGCERPAASPPPPPCTVLRGSGCERVPSGIRLHSSSRPVAVCRDRHRLPGPLPVPRCAPRALESRRSTRLLAQSVCHAARSLWLAVG